MKLGILQFEITIDGANSLKDKRRVVKGLKDRLHHEHMVSVAEVGSLEAWNRTVLGLACVSADGAHLHKVLDAIVRKLETLPEGRLVDVRKDIIDADQTPESELGEDGTPLWTSDERREGAQD